MNSRSLIMTINLIRSQISDILKLPFCNMHNSMPTVNRADSLEAQNNDLILLWLAATAGPKRPEMPPHAGAQENSCKYLNLLPSQVALKQVFRLRGHVP